MITHASGTYEIKSWDEKTWDGKGRTEQPGAKLTHALVTFLFHGDVEAEGKTQYLMAYQDDANATYVGLLQFDGQIGGRMGTCVLKIDGAFENGAATSTMTIIPGSGTGELAGIKGQGETVAVHADTQPFTLDYDFD